MGVSRKEKDSARAKCSRHLRKKRPLQILNAQYKVVAALRDLRAFQIRSHQVNSSVQRSPWLTEASCVAHCRVHLPRARLQRIQRDPGKIGRHDMLAACG